MAWKLEPIEESTSPSEDFNTWYARWAEKTGINPDPMDSRHKYDYRAAYKAGVEPTISDEDGQYHWPSEFKADDHPNRFVNGVDTKKPSGGWRLEPESPLSPSHTTYKEPMQAAHQPTIAQPGPSAEAVARESLRIASPVYRPALEGAGAAVGGILGVPAGPLGMVASGAAGYAVGKGIADIADTAAGVKEPYDSPKEMLKQTGEDLLTGAKMELSGQLIGAPLYAGYRGGKLVFNKAKSAAEGLLTKKGWERSAGRVLAANTSEGVIYARNAQEAANIEKMVPGLKFTIGQRTHDPQLIKFERGHVRAPGSAATVYKEQEALNSAALTKYYAENFPGEENVDDVIMSLAGKKESLQNQLSVQQDVVQGKMSALPRAGEEQTGESVVSALQKRKQEVKDTVDELYSKVPNLKIPVKSMLDDFDRITTPRYTGEKAENIPDLLGRVQRIMDQKLKPTPSSLVDAQGRPLPPTPAVKPEIMALNDLRGIRSELLEESRDVLSGPVPNHRLSARLKEGYLAVDRAIFNMESAEGAGALREANKFFREDYAGVFRQGTVDDILRKGVHGEETRIPIGKVPSRIWNTNNTTAATDFISAVGEGTAADIMRDHAAYDLMRRATDADGVIKPKALAGWYKNNQELLSKFKITNDFDSIYKAQQAADAAATAAKDFEKSAAARMLKSDPEQAIGQALAGKNTGAAMADVMKQVKGNKAAEVGLQNAFADYMLARVQMTTQDIVGNRIVSPAAFVRLADKYRPAMRALYKNDPGKLEALNTMQRVYEIGVRNLRSPIGGGSDTQENLLSAASTITSGLLSRPMSIARGLLRATTKYSTGIVNELLTRSIFDPEYADDLINAYLRSKDPAAAQAIIGRRIKDMEVRSGRLVDTRPATRQRVGIGVAGTEAIINEQQ